MQIKNANQRKPVKRIRFTWSQYVAYLRSEKWKRKRLAKGFKQNFTCERCGVYCKDSFEIHHKTYIHVFREPLNDLMFLCPQCHKILEAQKRRERKLRNVYKQRNAKINY